MPTLRELNAKAGETFVDTVGDKVFSVHAVYAEWANGTTIWKYTNGDKWALDGIDRWERVEPETTTAEAEPTPHSPTIWKDMTPQEQGALLLAFVAGKEIQYLWDGSWTLDTKFDPVKRPDIAYRAKPEAVRETVNVTIWHENGKIKLGSGTLDLIDGKPDASSIKMEVA